MARRDAHLRSPSLRSARIALFVVAVLPYLPAVLSRGAWSDDVDFLESARRSTSSLVDGQLANGRPVTAGLMWLQYTLAGGIGGLWWVRVIGVAGVAALAVHVAELLRRRTVSLPLAALIGSGVAFLPPMHMYAGWATCSLFGWASLLALIGESRWQAARAARSHVRAAVAAGLLAISLLVYPPAALVYWLAPALDLALRHPIAPTIRDHVRRLGSAALLGVTALAVALPVVLVVNQAAAIHLKQRAAFVSSPQELVRKVAWLATRPLVISARPFLISSPGAARSALVAIPVLGVVTWWLCASRPGPRRERLLGTGLVLSSLLWATAAHAVLKENQIDFRFFPGICMITWVLLALSLCQAPTTERRTLLRWGGRSSLPVLAAVVALAGWATWRNTTMLFADPFRAKDRFLRERLAAFDPGRQRAVVIVQPQAGWSSRAAIGVYSTVSDLAHPWVPVPNVQLLLEERGIDVGTVAVVVRAHDEAPTLAERDGSALVVDLTPLRDRLQA